MWLQNWFWKEETLLFCSSLCARCWHSTLHIPGHLVNMCSSSEWNKYLGFQEENFKQRSFEWTHVLAFLFFQLRHSVDILCVSVFLCCCCLCRFSCFPTLCYPVDCSSSVDVILQARIRGRLPVPSLGDLPDPGIEPASPVSSVLQADSLPLSQWEGLVCISILT